MRKIGFSIIIPVYNVEPYIRTCLESVKSQSYKEKIECLIIDDKGADRSITIVQEIVDNYHGNIDFKIFAHSQNKGLSAARNTALDHATGDYILFLDSDDTLVPDALKVINNCLNDGPVDLLGIDLIKKWEDSGKKESFPIVLKGYENLYKKTILRNVDVRNKIQTAPVQRYVCRRGFIEENKLRFYEGIIHEDVEFLGRAVFLARTIKLCNKPIYEYLQRTSGSIMSSLGANVRTLECRNLILKSLVEFRRNSAISISQKFFVNDYLLKTLMNLLCYLDVSRQIDSFIMKNEWYYRKIAFGGLLANMYYVDFKRILKSGIIIVSPLLFRRIILRNKD